MRFAVRYPTGAVHEVELHGTVAIVGRDPSCDLVLNDIKCSRRHAVIEAGADGLSIRDSGSSNGVFVNGKRLERSRLREGDVVRLGDIQLTVLEEDTPQTLSMGSDDATPAGQATTFLPKGFVPPPPPPPPPPAAPSAHSHTAVSEVSRAWALGEAEPEAPIPSRPRRPLTVTVLALLWIVSGLLYGAGGVVAAFFLHGLAAVGAVCGGVLFAAVAGVMVWGLLALKGWARILQIVLAVFGLPVCPFSCASVVVLIYMLQGSTRAHFSRGAMPEPSSKEGLFTGGVLACVVLGGLLTAALTGFVVFLAKGGALR